MIDSEKIDRRYAEVIAMKVEKVIPKTTVSLLYMDEPHDDFQTARRAVFQIGRNGVNYVLAVYIPTAERRTHNAIMLDGPITAEPALNLVRDFLHVEARLEAEQSGAAAQNEEIHGGY